MLKVKNLAVIALVAMLFVASCSSGRYNIYNIKNAASQEVACHGLMYALPKTVLRVEVEATRVELQPGPYGAFASKYLGILNVPKHDSVSWIISDIKINSYAEPDPDHYYFIESDKPIQSDLLHLTEQGIIVSANCNVEHKSSESSTDLFLNQAFSKPIELSQLPVMDAQTERIDTTYRTIFTDSSFMRIPVMRRQQVNKSLEEKAKEIAELILELREEKVALLTGDIDEFPDGEALRTILEEFEQIEQQYLPLFTGTRSEQVFRSVYEFTPTFNNQDSKNILFRFSNQKGVLSNTDLSGKPIMVDVKNQDYTTNFAAFLQHKDTLVEEPKGLFYRIPDEAVVQILNDSKVIATHKLQIAQYGKVDALPFRFLNNQKQQIEFYPETGALKKIEKQ